MIWPTAIHKPIEYGAFLPNYSARSMAGIEPRLVRPGEEDALHVLHGQREGFRGLGGTRAAHEERISNQNASIAQVEASRAGGVTGRVDNHQT